MRLPSALAAVLIWSTHAPAQGPPVALTPAERAWVAAHPTVRMMGNIYYEPACFFDDAGNHAGIAADVLKLVADRTGLTFDVIKIPPHLWKVYDPKVRGTDGVTCSARSPERDKFYDMTTPYLEFPAYIITRQSTPKYLHTEDLYGLTVAVVAGYALEEHLRTNHPNITLVPVANTDVGLKKASFGVVDAFVSDMPVSTYRVEKEGFANLKVAGETDYVYRLGITSRKDWPELGTILQKGIESITPAEHEAIRKKWLNVPYEPFFRSRRFWQPVGAMSVGAAAALLVLLVWNRLLRREVRRQVAQIRRAEEQLRHKQRLETIGVLAGGIAHDFNHLLQCIYGFAQLAREPDTPTETRDEYLTQVTTAADKAGQVVRQLLTYSRKRPTEKRKWELHEVAAEMLPLIGRLVGKRHEVVLAAVGRAWATADRGQVEQVLMNLVVNARDAMPAGGVIVVTVATDPSGPLVRVRDTGTGMSEEVLAQVFEPFFTTKPSDQGTGLGLAVVQRIVEDHGGKIDVQTKPGEGTTVTVWWPVAE